MTNLSPEQKQAALQRHREILLATLDYLLAKNDNMSMSNSKDGSVQIRRYYFDNGILFNKLEKGKPLNKPEAFLQHAANYLNDVKTLYNQ